ncbi:DUF4142 domain-containing protein [Rhizobium paknamense]|uniref:Membrane protein n=1 Tax=Rhizobium paknamense TaxID=1206817 RepID=A0ABU0ID31_9HYPH|nr:DUF4142 domain-containing protein [Rhizobium paknamense]MDQ0455587.1 putative membrane protein [Rhizobium paknamense]
MTVKPLLIAPLALLYAASVSAQQAPQMPPPAVQTPQPPTPANNQAKAPTPQEFAAQAAAANLFEIKAAAIADQKAQSEAVKAFARQLAQDHRRAQAELVEAAKSENIQLSETLPEEQQTRLEALEAAPDQFDAAFLSAQVNMHEQAMRLMSAYADQGKAGPLKTYAASEFATLRMHFLRAQSFSQ